MTATQMPPTSRQVGDDTLRAALQDVLQRHFAAPCRVEGLRRRLSEKRSSFALEELDVTLDDGRSLALIWKDVGCGALVRCGTWAKPAFLCNPRREIETYLSILAPAGLGTATCYGAWCHPRRGRYWLFLERVPAQELYLRGWETWLEAARWLARMHCRLAGAAGSDDWMPAVPLLHCDAAYFRRWLRRAQVLTAYGSDPARARRGLSWLARRYELVVERLVSLPATFIHGEFYAPNVLVGEAGDGVRICPVDWEMAAVGPGLLDLAALTAGNWSTEQQKILASAYGSALPSGPSDPQALQFCRLHLAVQWLAWGTRPTAAPHEAHDWLSEALCLGEQLL